MVSKPFKRTPTKSLKHPRRRTPKRSPVKGPSVVASLNQSFCSCQRRLIKIFSKLARIGTPNRRKGYKVLRKFHDNLVFDENLDREDDKGVKIPLSPALWPEAKTIFLDLDETLVHSQSEPRPEKYDFVVRPRIDGTIVSFYVLKRPGVDEFLKSLAGTFEVVVFTAGLREYASLVLDRLDPEGLISTRLYRDSCRQVEGKFLKDLRMLGRDMRRVVIVDDNPNAYECNPENAIPVKPFVDDMEDEELGKLEKFFEGCDGFEDLRDAVKDYLASR